MAERKSFRERVEARRKTRRSPFGLVVFLVAVLVCGVVGWGLFSIVFQPGESTSGFSLSINQTPDQWVLNLYLRLRQKDIEARPSGAGDVSFTIQSGDSAASVGARLQRLGLVNDADLFRLLARARGVETRLEVGDYQLQRGMSMDEILAALQHGRAKTVTVRVIEGWRIEETAAALQKNTSVRSADFVAAAKAGPFSFAFLKDRPANSTLEGFLFPDTYDVPADASAEQIISLMLTNFDKKVGSELWSKASAQGLTGYQLLSVASIVEREAQKPDERATIASVYLNRLKRGMKLEADPTVQYAMGYQSSTGMWWKTPVSLEEYSTVDSAYNTYLKMGLPPTPICSPGIGAIRAAFEPAKTEFLFFLARGDGSHVFARTFEEHQANIARYQK